MNQKPDKWISNDCKAGMHTSCAALGCEDDCGHAIRTKKVIAVLDDSKPDTTLREQLANDLERYKNYGTPFTQDMVSHVLTEVAKRLPEEKPIIDQDYDDETFHRTTVIDANHKGFNQCLSEVRAIIEANDG